MNTQSDSRTSCPDSCRREEAKPEVTILNADAFRNLGGVEASESACRQVLIADDDPMFRRILQARLQAWGYEVFAVENGSQAWDLLQAQVCPDLLILDRMMPGIDGIELCRRIRSRQTDRYQYILLISGKDEKCEIVEGLDAGADDYLTKPFDIGELHARIRAGNRVLLLQRNLMKALEALRYQATHDDLTGLWSRGAALHLLRAELDRGTRSAKKTGLLLIDLDHFKKVNDTYGHLSGDAVLRKAASRISMALRSYDVVGRYGGEEFVVVLSQCIEAEVGQLAERIRHIIGESLIAAEGFEIPVTVSIGGTLCSGTSDVSALLAIADSALYEAKRNGRNRVVIADQKSPVIPVAGSEECALGGRC